jgi:hypothetical protein
MNDQFPFKTPFLSDSTSFPTINAPKRSKMISKECISPFALPQNQNWLNDGLPNIPTTDFEFAPGNIRTISELDFTDPPSKAKADKLIVALCEGTGIHKKEIG